MNGAHDQGCSRTRRRFLIEATGAAAAMALCARAEDPATLPSPASRASIGPVDPSAKSIVAHIRAEEVISASQVHPSLVGEMIEEGVRAVTGQPTPQEAWRRLLRDDDVIAVKFNQVAADALATTEPFATQLVESLQRAGLRPDRVMLIEAPTELSRRLGTRKPVTGWSGRPVAFASGEEQLAAFLQEVTAIINVPFLKTHNLAGMSGCLKNLSHALVRRPARYHGQACAPYVADILSIPQIRSRVRIHLVNALRCVVEGGPQATPETVWAHRGVIVSRDPVAADTVGLDILNDRRARTKLPPIGDAGGRLAQLRTAAERGLGTDDQDYITLLQPAVT